MNDQMVDKAMDIIMHAGDARLAYRRAMESLLEGRTDESKAKLKEAETEITLAHQVQTDCIQGAVRGEDFEYNVLFAHAQDTLMTIYSEIMVVKQMTAMYEKLDDRIKQLEESRR